MVSRNEGNKFASSSGTSPFQCSFLLEVRFVLGFEDEDDAPVDPLRVSDSLRVSCPSREEAAASADEDEGDAASWYEEVASAPEPCGQASKDHVLRSNEPAWCKSGHQVFSHEETKVVQSCAKGNT